jgi:hypothetical protein
MGKHVNYILSVITQRLYLINQLRKTGVSTYKAREVVFHSLIISHLLCALPAFACFLSCANITHYDALFRKSVRWGILDRLFDFDEVIAAAENRLFKRFSFNLDHCLDCYLRDEIPVIYIQLYILRKRGHNFLLPDDMKTLFRKSHVINYSYKTK